MSRNSGSIVDLVQYCNQTFCRGAHFGVKDQAITGLVALLPPVRQPMIRPFTIASKKLTPNWQVMANGSVPFVDPCPENTVTETSHVISLVCVLSNTLMHSLTADFYNYIHFWKCSRFFTLVLDHTGWARLWPRLKTQQMETIIMHNFFFDRAQTFRLFCTP